MKIDILKEYKLTKNEEATIDWLNKHKIGGYLVTRKENTTYFNLRKSGMLGYFTCKLDYTKINLTSYLEALDEALTLRCEQEDLAKQCRILKERIQNFLYRAGESTFFFYDSECYPLLKDIVTFADKYPKYTHVLTFKHKLPLYREIVKLFEEYQKLLTNLGTDEYEKFLGINLDDYYYAAYTDFEYPQTND